MGVRSIRLTGVWYCANDLSGRQDSTSFPRTIESSPGSVPFFEKMVGDTGIEPVTSAV